MDPKCDPSVDDSKDDKNVDMPQESMKTSASSIQSGPKLYHDTLGNHFDQVLGEGEMISVIPNFSSFKFKERYYLPHSSIIDVNGTVWSLIIYPCK